MKNILLIPIRIVQLVCLFIVCLCDWPIFGFEAAQLRWYLNV